jgi:hypothetical protein
MKTMLRWTSALCMLSVSTMASAQSLPTGFAVGYNEAWFENYGAWLASNPLFTEPSAITPGCTPSNTCSGLTLVSNMLSGMMKGNAKIVRIWLFPALQGICINTTLTTCPQATQGLTSDFLNNLTQVFTLARSYNLKLYITALNANDATLSPSMYPALHTYYQNLFSNSNNYNSVATQTYENSALGPILGLMSQYQDVIYGFDLINEIEAEGALHQPQQWRANIRALLLIHQHDVVFEITTALRHDDPALQ